MLSDLVETLLTHLIRENEKQGQLDLLCASVTDDAARRAAEGWQHTKMLYINRPGGHRRYWPMVFLERCAGIAAPYDPWYQKVQLSLALEARDVLSRSRCLSADVNAAFDPTFPDVIEKKNAAYLNRGVVVRSEEHTSELQSR